MYLEEPLRIPSILVWNRSAQNSIIFRPIGRIAQFLVLPPPSRTMTHASSLCVSYLGIWTSIISQLVSSWRDRVWLVRSEDAVPRYQRQWFLFPVRGSDENCYSSLVICANSTLASKCINFLFFPIVGKRWNRVKSGAPVRPSKLIWRSISSSWSTSLFEWVFELSLLIYALMNCLINFISIFRN